MAEYQYTNVTGKLRDLMNKIRETGVPQRATTKWLESIGFKSKNDRSLLGVLKQVEFTNEDGEPTDRWNLFRGGNHGQVLAAAIAAGYSELFATYPDAYQRSDTDLEAFFSTRSAAGRQVVTRTVATLKVLFDLAEFSDSPLGGQHAPLATAPVQPAIPPTALGAASTASPLSPSIHIDIQIHISPETTSEQVDLIFSSMAKHLYKVRDA